MSGGRLNRLFAGIEHGATMRTFASVAFVLLTACASQPQVGRVQAGQWRDWRAMLVGQMLLIPSNAPEELRWSFINCAVDTSLKFYTPAELAKLNAHANGAAFLSDSEVNAIDSQMNARIGGKPGLKAEMAKSCPDTVQQAEAFKSAS